MTDLQGTNPLNIEIEEFSINKITGSVHIGPAPIEDQVSCFGPEVYEFESKMRRKGVLCRTGFIDGSFVLP